jgi:hypothetical protein
MKSLISLDILCLKADHARDALFVVSSSPRRLLSAFSSTFRHQDPILRLRNLQLQRRRCSRAFVIVGRRKYCLFLKRTRLHVALYIFFSAGVVTRGRRIGSRYRQLVFCDVNDVSNSNTMLQ